jgi:hypothetical protein
VLVVVDMVPGVAVITVHVVEMALVGDRHVATAILVHVHVPRMRDVGAWARGHALQVVDVVLVHVVDMAVVEEVHVVLVDVVDVAVVEEVHVVLVWHRGVAAEAVVHVGVLLQRLMRSGVDHRYLRAPR